MGDRPSVRFFFFSFKRKKTRGLYQKVVWDRTCGYLTGSCTGSVLHLTVAL